MQGTDRVEMFNKTGYDLFLESHSLGYDFSLRRHLKVFDIIYWSYETFYLYTWLKSCTRYINQRCAESPI
jgi:hypothetical protein